MKLASLQFRDNANTSDLPHLGGTLVVWILDSTIYTHIVKQNTGKLHVLTHTKRITKYTCKVNMPCDFNGESLKHFIPVENPLIPSLISHKSPSISQVRLSLS